MVDICIDLDRNILLNMTKTKILTESITSHIFKTTNGYTICWKVRCWRQQLPPFISSANAAEIEQHWLKFPERSLSTTDERIAEYLLKLKGMNAVEVIEVSNFHSDRGVVLYKNWP